ncbi:hypothetical protein L3Q82_007194 [Scortum barcoo]|uniref:Uncharacterized protein n=1 Tax=Scortum barcoo TaxID=214431 RepID=A0ACB8WVC4_9TELE|nr:hypothetical protein L3Q82_007194 [Scortum barcoo]
MFSLPIHYCRRDSSKLWAYARSPVPAVGVDGYRQAKQVAAARTVLEAKTRVWKEFGEATEEDYRSASKRFWQTVRRLRTRTIGRWKEYFKDLLNPTDTPSTEEAEAGDSEVDSSITKAEVN